MSEYKSELEVTEVTKVKLNGEEKLIKKVELTEEKDTIETLNIDYKGYQKLYEVTVLEIYEKLERNLCAWIKFDTDKGNKSDKAEKVKNIRCYLIKFINTYKDSEYKSSKNCDKTTDKFAEKNPPKDYIPPNRFIAYLQLEPNNTNEADNELCRIFTEHYIKTIWMSYNLLKVFFTFEQLYDQLFLLLNDSRKAMLTEGVVFNLQKKECNETPPPQQHVLDWYRIERQPTIQRTKTETETGTETGTKLDDFTITSIKLYRGNTEIQKGENKPFLIWLGCQMTLPTKTQITLSFDSLYPTFYLGKKNRNTRGGCNEIFMEEHPWTINAIYDTELGRQDDDIGSLKPKETSVKVLAKFANGLAYKDLKEGELSDLQKIGVNKSKLFEKQNLLNISSKYNYKEEINGASGTINREEDVTSPPSFRRFDFEVFPNSEDYDLILQMPYAPPKADMLVSLKINKSPQSPQGSDPFEEVILTTS